MTPEQIKAFIAEREADRKVLVERIEQLDHEIHDLRCRLVGVWYWDMRRKMKAALPPPDRPINEGERQ